VELLVTISTIHHPPIRVIFRPGGNNSRPADVLMFEGHPSKGLGLRLRTTLVFVIIVAVVVAVGAWADRPRVAVDHVPQLVTAKEPWSAIVEISRHGRRLDGFRPVLTISGPIARQSFHGTEVGPGRYRVRVVFPVPGIYTYTVTVPNGVASRGTISAVPQ
jgi:hypothetical protein